MTGRKINQFLGFYGVDESMISPFCKDFESISELRDELLLQSPQILQQQQKEQGTDTWEHFDEDSIVEEIPNIEKVQSMTTRVQKNMKKSINDREA